jgi:protease-4
MKSFFKYLLASILGVIIATFILFFITLGIVSAIVASQEKPVDISENTILQLNLNQPINDRKSPMPVLVYNITTLGTESQLGLNDILKNISRPNRIPIFGASTWNSLPCRPVPLSKK